jgi:hypothetical protein
MQSRGEPFMGGGEEGGGGVTMNRRTHKLNNGSERGVGGFPDVWGYLEIFSIKPGDP